MTQPLQHAMQMRIEALEEENRALTADKRDLETAIYAISHDLRAPLRALDGFASLLAMDMGAALPAAATRDIAEIRAGVARMHDLLRCWLRIARCDYAELSRQRVDLTGLAEDVLRELRIAEPHRAVRCVISQGLVAEGDPALLRELLQNLLGNAWKFTQDNATTAEIEIGARRDRNEVTYFVRDNGIGFDPANTQALFRPFKSLHTTIRFGGTGLGLAIARRIVERHDGRIWAEGATGSGATFSFTLPVPVRAPNPSRNIC